MRFQKYLVLGVLALEFTTCICQFGGELMGGEMLGLFGGLAFMSGQGGMSGLGGMNGLGGISGMGGLGGSSLGGMSGLGGMSSLGGLGGMGGLGGQSAMNELGTVTIDRQGTVTGLDAVSGQNNTGGFAGTGGTDRTNETSQRTFSNVSDSLTRAVQFIVGPTAVPDQEIIDYAMRRGREPSSRRDLVRYIPHMQRIARTTYGEFLAYMASQNASSSADSEKASNSTTNTPIGAGKSLSQLLADLDVMVLQRANEWSREQSIRRRNNVMTEMSRTMPQWFPMF